MLAVSLALLLTQPGQIEKLKVPDICSLGYGQFKSFYRNWNKETELSGIVIEVEDHDDFSNVKILSHKNHCKVISVVLMPKEVVEQLEVGTSVRLQGNFLIPTYGKCSTRWSTRECKLKFVFTNGI